MDVPANATVGILGFFALVGLLPSLPTAFRYLLALVAFGLGGWCIYTGFDQIFFLTPMGEDSKIPMVAGGTGGMSGFNKASIGVIAPVLGTLSLVFGLVVRAVLLKVMRKKESSN